MHFSCFISISKKKISENEKDGHVLVWCRVSIALMQKKPTLIWSWPSQGKWEILLWLVSSATRLKKPNGSWSLRDMWSLRKPGWRICQALRLLMSLRYSMVCSWKSRKSTRLVDSRFGTFELKLFCVMLLSLLSFFLFDLVHLRKFGVVVFFLFDLVHLSWNSTVWISHCISNEDCWKTSSIVQ